MRGSPPFFFHFFPYPMPSDPEKEIYVNIAVIRDTLEILVKRGKPASVADLQTLMASVEAKSRPNYILPAKEVADALAPKLLPLLPTPDILVQAGQQSAVRMEAAIKAGTVDSVKLIQVTMQKFVDTLVDSADKALACAAEYTSATKAAPRSLPVSFTDGWRWPVGLIAVSVVVTLLISWSGGAFRGVSQVDYKMVYDLAKKSTEERDEFRAQVRAFRRDMSEGKDAKEATKMAKAYFPPIGLDTIAAK